MELSQLFQVLLISAGLGLLVGLQRESASSQLAGIRTFALVAIYGTVCGWLGKAFGGWVIAGGLITLGILIYSGRALENREVASDIGLTTEVAMLLVFGVGCYAAVGSREIAIAIGAGTAVLLQFKVQLHGLVRRLGPDDLKAIMQFALISMVILPILPNRDYGPYSVLNPRNIWLMVVLIVGINLGAYITYKFFGDNAGIVLAGILGGLISSTATTVSYARDAHRSNAINKVAIIVMLISSAVVYPRLLLEVATVAPGFTSGAAIPLGAMTLLLSCLAAFFWFRGKNQQRAMPVHSNPTELKPALIFGFLYALVTLLVAATRARLGTGSLYLVAGISGLAEVDALTLSTARLVDAGRLASEEGWRIILTATMSNLGLKALLTGLLGNRSVFYAILWTYGIAILCGISMIVWFR